MQQSNASSYNLLNLGGTNEFIQNVLAVVGGFETGELVEVTAVKGGGLDMVGFVSVKILTQRTNADNTNVDLGEIHNVPYFRISGGKNAVIIDPQVGDLGFCGFCSRDISLVKRVRGLAAQNTIKYSDISDAFFFGGWSKEKPEQYIYFDGNDVKIKAKSRVLIESPEVEMTGNLLVRGRADVLGVLKGHKDVYDEIGSIDSIRNAYNRHKHDVIKEGQPTSIPDVQVD